MPDTTEGLSAEVWARAFHDMSKRASDLICQRNRACQIVNDRDDEVARLREALTEAVSYCTGRVGQIGASQVYTPQIDVKAAERWRKALRPDA